MEVLIKEMFLYWRNHDKCFANGFEDLKQEEIDFNNLSQELISNY